MARVSKKVSAARQEAENAQHRVWKAAIYARLSDFDDVLRDTESLEVQISYIKEYIDHRDDLMLLDGTLYFYCASCHVSISEKDLWNGINKELHQRMEEHRDLQKLVRKSSGKSKLQSKEITTKRKIEQVMGNVVRLESQKRSGYEQYVLGKLSKEKFLELKQGLENEITTLKQTKAEKEKELAVVQEELQRKKQIAGSTEVLLTADNLQQYVKKIEVDRGKITYTEFLL